MLSEDAYRRALLKHGVAVELPSPLHMQALCSDVLSSSDVSQTTRAVVESGRFSSEKKRDGFVVERNFLLIPSITDVVRSVVLDLMPFVSTGTKSGYSALEILKTLRPSGYPVVKMDAGRLVRDAAKNEYGDVASAYAAFDLTGMPSDDYVKVRSIKHDDRDWVVLLGVQIPRTNLYSWDAAEALPLDEWQPDADEWHSYYGRRVMIGKDRRVLGRRVTFYPDKIKGRVTAKRKNKPPETKLGLPEDAGEVFIY